MSMLFSELSLEYVSEGLYSRIDDKFNTQGKYTLFFYVQDTDDIVYYSNQCYVYKSKENNTPPMPFQLISPMNLDNPVIKGIQKRNYYKLFLIGKTLMTQKGINSLIPCGYPKAVNLRQM